MSFAHPSVDDFSKQSSFVLAALASDCTPHFAFRGTTMTEHEKTFVLSSLNGTTLVLEIQTDQIRDTETASAISREMIALAKENQANRLVIDMHSVCFMGSVGFLALMGLRRHLDEPSIILCGLSEHLKDILEACKLISRDPDEPAMFAMTDTVDEAMQRN
ncbi:MAG: STAS domain-containing protein [Phycisphaera sp. RhM]|nr:STAS domain-containing protein [Phycisphaera sp. RhM]